MQAAASSVACRKSRLFQLAVLDRLHETLSQIIADTTGEFQLLDRIHDRGRIDERPAKSSNVSRKRRTRSVRRMADAYDDVRRRALRWKILAHILGRMLLDVDVDLRL